MAEKFEIGWIAPCRRAGMRWANASTAFLPTYDLSTRDRFVEIINARGAGNRVCERRWRGVFRVRVRVFRGSRLLTRCYKRTAWRVLRRG